MIRVGVFGAGGRMGSTVCRAVVDDPDLELVGAVDPQHAGIDLRQLGVAGAGLNVAPNADAFVAAGAEVAVDFTVIDAARQNLAWCAEHGVHAVVGTSGFEAEEVERLRTVFDGSRAHAVIVPNFAISAVLMMRFAELAAPYFDTVEIIELHHDGKVDAPSGTALATAERLAAASPDWGPDPTTKTVLEGARGGSGAAGIPIHSVRLRGLQAHQEVLFGTTGQSLTIRQDSYDRTSYMPGVLRAIKSIRDKPGLTFGLDALLGL
ncbi:MAG TPA: 4-hydroxy-tetrahydrodipicolinate reductase [Acidimicrobiia bacterium]|nr:4-hydroxy-tetrahydrodipicolinate reductase [Acidimicrobiia bacterium]